MAGIKDQERLFKALANKRRISILAHLKKRTSSTVGNISDAINLSFKATSKHLGILSAAGLLDREQISLEMHYRIADDLSSNAKSVLSIL